MKKTRYKKPLKTSILPLTRKFYLKDRQFCRASLCKTKGLSYLMLTLIIWMFTCLYMFSINAKAGIATIEQADQVFLNYDKDISNIQKAIDLYNQVIKENTNAKILSIAYAKISMAYLTMGDFSSLNHTDPLKDYEAGKIAAQKAISLDPENSDAYFWYAGNLGRMAQLKNFMAALFILPEFKKYLAKAYELNPDSLFVLEAYAEFYYQLPRPFGGSYAKSIEFAKKALKIDPHYTMPYTTLAKVYISEDKYDIAKQLLEKVIHFKDPSYRAGWIMYDKPLAQKLYNSIENKK